MRGFEYYLKIDERHHDEVYRLLETLQQDIDEGGLQEEHAHAQARLDELVKLSEDNKREQ